MVLPIPLTFPIPPNAANGRGVPSRQIPSLPGVRPVPWFATVLQGGTAFQAQTGFQAQTAFQALTALRARACWERGAAPLLQRALDMGGALILGAALLLTSQSAAQAGSALLDRVKQNPKVAAAICSELRGLNAQGITSTSPQAVGRIATLQGLNATDAEILTTYVVGLHCPDVR